MDKKQLIQQIKGLRESRVITYLLQFLLSHATTAI